MIGLYSGITLSELTGIFYWLIGGAAIAGIVGLVIYQGFLRYRYMQELGQILITFGFVYIIENLIIKIWGSWPKKPFIPSFLSGFIPIGNCSFLSIAWR